MTESDELQTLGYHRRMCAAVFGEDSEATKFLDMKIAEAPDGEDEMTVVPESQVIFLLGKIHFDGTPAETVAEEIDLSPYVEKAAKAMSEGSKLTPEEEIQLLVEDEIGYDD